MDYLDIHVHYSEATPPRMLIAFLDETQTARANLVTVPHSRFITLTPGALAMKHMCPGRFYTFSCLDASFYYLYPERLGQQMAQYAAALRKMGCDGIKLLEGKPQMRRLLPVPDFDADCWDAFWQYAEESGLPVLMHLNDPASFWSDSIPNWQRALGWAYDESYVGNEAQYTQMLKVLKRHPKLKIIFAHFFFMSESLERLGEIMDMYPNVAVDLTPGIEMYESFSADIDRASAFFTRFVGRIFYGTDIGGRCVLGAQGKSFNRAENRLRPRIVREFLTMKGEKAIVSDGDYLIGRPEFIMRGMGLEGERLESIAGAGFLRYVGESASVSPGAMLEECGRLKAELDALKGGLRGFTPDYSCINCAQAYFSENV